MRHIDTTKRFAKSRKYLPFILCCIGASLTISTVSSLLRYRDASEKYRARVDPIMNRIIREHGGEIEIQSQPDQGTNILIYLPHTAPSPRLLPSPPIDY